MIIKCDIYFLKAYKWGLFVTNKILGCAVLAEFKDKERIIMHLFYVFMHVLVLFMQNRVTTYGQKGYYLQAI